jgi:hypothetical protein
MESLVRRGRCRESNPHWRILRIVEIALDSLEKKRKIYLVNKIYKKNLGGIHERP